MSIDDEDEIKAMENRLRTSGWMEPAPELTKAQLETQRIRSRLPKLASVPDSKRVTFGTVDTKLREAGLWLALNWDDAPRPLRPFLADRFKLSFDDAGRVVSEAERLIERAMQ